MERTPYRLILPKSIDKIPNEGMRSMECIRDNNFDFRLVSYLSTQEYERQTKDISKEYYECPITQEPCLFDGNWVEEFKKALEDKKDGHLIISGPQIIPQSTVVYVSWKNQMIAKFYDYTSDGLIFNRNGATSFAELFVEQLINNTK